MLSKHNQRELRKLILSVRANENRLDLFVAVCNDRSLQARLIQEYEATFQEEGIATYQAWLDLKQPSLKATLTALVERERSLQKESKAVVTVLGGADLLGIKLTEQEDKSEQDKLFFSLQWTRESLRDFTFPVIFWLSDAVTTRLAQQAPDFWSWRGGVFEFEDEAPDDSTSPVYPEPSPSFLDQRDEHEQPSRPIADMEQEIAALYQQNPDSPLLISLYNNLGQAHYHNNDYEAALAAYNQAKTLAQTHKDKLQEVKALYGLGDTLGRLRRFEQALERLEHALEIAKTIDDQSGQGMILGELGRIYQFLGQYEQAIAFNKQALTISRQIQDRRGEAYFLKSLGFIYHSRGQYQQAFEVVQQALEIFRQVHDTSGKLESLRFLVDTYGFLIDTYDHEQATAIAIYQKDKTILDKALDEILGKDNPYAYTTFSFIKRALRQYQLHWRMEPHDVLHEAYQRGTAALKAGKTITNPYAWLKKTSLNIIQEYSRSKKDVPTDPTILSDIVSDDDKPMEQLIWQEELQDLREQEYSLQLDKALDEILGKDNPYAYTTFSFIKRALRQYQLHWRMEPHDVLHEAYQRGITALKAGKTITNPHAWLKKTSLNIIREYSRSKKDVPTDPTILSDIVSDDDKPMEQLIWQEELRDLQETVAIFAREEPEAFELLCLRTLDRLSWQDIAEHWSAKYGQPVNDVALRKKLSRTKKKFRFLFHRLGESQE